MQEINDIKEENFDYLQKVIGLWMAGEVDHNKMVAEF